MKNKNALMTSAVMAAAGTTFMAGAVGAQEKPNMVVILTDDIDFDEIGVYDIKKYPCRTGARELGFTEWREDWRAYDDPRMLTPHIDSLARDGLRFNRFYVTTSICTPSRYSILTGRYASRSAFFQEKYPPGGSCLIRWDTFLGADEGSLPRELKKLGYVTGMAGKWHLSAGEHADEHLPRDADPRDPQMADAIRAKYDREVERVKNESGFDEVLRLAYTNKESSGRPKAAQAHNIEWTIEGALDFMQRHRTDPFFLYLPLTVPHSQFDAMYGEFTDADPLATPAGMLEKAPQVQPSRESLYTRLKERGIDPRNAMGTWIDDSVGAVLEKLDALNLADNTLVVFLSDHQSRGKYSCYESCRVPCLMRWPGRLQEGRQTDAICANIDLAPTFIELAGGDPDKSMPMDGRSLTPVLRGKAGAGWRDALLLECTYTRAVVTPEWKYIANRPPADVQREMEEEAMHFAETGELRQIGWDGQKNPHKWGEVGIRYVLDVDFPSFFDYDQLYSMTHDPFEQVNLADDPLHRTTMQQMQMLLRRELKDMPHTFGEFKPE